MAERPVEKTIEKSAYRLVEMLQLQEDEERTYRLTKQRLEAEMEGKMKELSDLEMEKIKLEAEITSLKLGDEACRREQLNLRNSITLIKFKIEKIKEGIEDMKKKELEDLKEFERTVDEITEKFRSSPGLYDRESLSQKLEEERERRKFLLARIQETKEAYVQFHREKGLRERRHEDEDILSCALPGSEAYQLKEMINNLDEVIGFMRCKTKDLEEKKKELKELSDRLNELQKTSNMKDDESEN